MLHLESNEKMRIEAQVIAQYGEKMLSCKVMHDSLMPLHQLKKLVKFECSFCYSSEEFKALHDELPVLKFGKPFELNEPITNEPSSSGH